jgi:hypothetical protein
MKLGFPYKEGDIVPIYNNWELQDKITGTAKLVSFIRHGRSFILEDTYPESDQIVYNYEEWAVEWPPKYLLKDRITFEKIRFVDTIGIANSTDDEDYDPESDPKLPKDSFITVNGISCF